MKKIVFAASAAVVAMSATPALAQENASNFTGPRAGVEFGVAGDDFMSTTRATYGLNVGYDADLGGAIVGMTAGYTDVFDDNNLGFREISIGGRAGVVAAPSALLYASAAYSDINTGGGLSVDGYKLGLGAEVAINDSIYATVETRYADYDAGVELYQTAVGFGIRF